MANKLQSISGLVSNDTKSQVNNQDGTSKIPITSTKPDSNKNGKGKIVLCVSVLVLFLVLLGAITAIVMVFATGDSGEPVTIAVGDEQDDDKKYESSSYSEYSDQLEDTHLSDEDDEHKPNETSHFSGPVRFAQEDIRLVGSAMAGEGRVEISYGGTWGTVCDDYWGIDEAHVVCRQLGYFGAEAYYRRAAFGQGSGQIWLDNVDCNGFEDYLSDCDHLGWGTHNCAHSEDASVKCIATAPEINVRLAGVRSDGQPRQDNEGRVEVQIDGGDWGTVCDDKWSGRRNSYGDENTDVLCYQLGYRDENANHEYYIRGFYGEGVGSILIDNLRCDGSETNFYFCSRNDFGNHNCDHREDVGIKCGGSLTGAVADTTPPVISCPSSTTVAPGEVVTFMATATDNDDEGNPTSTASTIAYSSSPSITITVGSNYEGTATITTSTTITATATDNNGNIGTSCTFSYSTAGNPLDTTNPVVQCPASITVSAGDSVDFHVISATDVNDIDGDTGTPTISYTSTDATHDLSGAMVTITDTATITAMAEDPAGNTADCSVTYTVPPDPGAPCTEGDVRLVGGRNEATYKDGRVEICHNNEWGTVCDDAWSVQDATVVCNQLGYPTDYVGAHGVSAFGSGTPSSPILLDQVSCSGTESNLLDCSSNALGDHDCIHYEDAGVTCASDPIGSCSTTGEVRLVGGTLLDGQGRIRSGRVEICHNGAWGTVCDDAWDNNDAEVVCRQLGFSTGTSLASKYAHFGRAEHLDIWLDDMQCSGSENTLASCCGSSCNWGFHNCNHQEDAGVVCEPDVIPNPLLPTSVFSTCGTTPGSARTKRETKIIGGANVNSDKDWPWSTFLSYVGYGASGFFCGASIISEEWAMTAAHCVDTGNFYDLNFGSNDKSSANAVLVRAFQHPSYFNVDYDVALLKILQPLTLADNVQPVCLATSSDETGSGQYPPPSTTCYVVGWGRTTATVASSPERLQELQVDLKSTLSCMAEYAMAGYPYVTNQMICSVSSDGQERGSCFGDSGGPLVCKKNGYWHLIGLTSWGIDCQDPSDPYNVGLSDVLARVSKFHDFIQQTIRAYP